MAFVDYLRSIMLDTDQSSNNVTVEEGIDCRETNSRFFSLLNHESRLNIIISKTSTTIISCKLNDHEIVVGQRQYNQAHETWALGDRPFQKIELLSWNCHVRGAELLLSVQNGTSSMMYELTRHNELNNIVKLKSINLQQQAVYFNLNNAKEKLPINGHTLVVRCNGNMNRIQVQQTRLLCQCNKRSSVLPQSLIGDVPFELVQHDASSSMGDNTNISDDDLIVCDAIFSLESTCAFDYIQVQLGYNNRALLFELKASPASSSRQSGASNQISSVSSSTTMNPTQPSQQPYDLQSQLFSQYVPSSSIGSSNAPSNSLLADINYSENKWFRDPADAPSTSCQPNDNSNPPSNITLPSSLSHPATNLRIRIRVTNFGVCIMPLMMTNYSCVYRFIW